MYHFGFEGISHVKCCRFFNVSANVAVAIFRVFVGNQPTEKITKGGVLREAQADIPCSLKPFQSTKRTGATGERCLFTMSGDVPSLTGFLPWLKSLTCWAEGLLPLLGRRCACSNGFFFVVALVPDLSN
jgi:hypothetical protein